MAPGVHARVGGGVWTRDARPLKGMVYVAPEGTKSDAALERWVGRGLTFVSEKPPSPARKRAARAPKQ